MQERNFLLDNILGRRGFSVSDLCRMTGLGRSTVDLIRKNGGGRRENMDLIADALGIEYEQLYEDFSTPNESKSISPDFDNSEFLKYAEQYRKEGDIQFADELLSIAKKIGRDVRMILSRADDLYAQDLVSEALREYSLAFSVFRQRDIPRMLLSLHSFMLACEADNDIRPIESLFARAKSENFRSFELFHMLSVFFLKNKAGKEVILASLKEVVDTDR